MKLLQLQLLIRVARVPLLDAEGYSPAPFPKREA